jgi:hypothetical protein
MQVPELISSVAVTFADPAVAAEWLRWHREGHIAEVLTLGATSAEIIRMDATNCHFEVRYRFASPEAFALYERRHAPRVRAEGNRLFPPDKGVVYRRTAVLVIDSFVAKTPGTPPTP